MSRGAISPSDLQSDAVSSEAEPNGTPRCGGAVSTRTLLAYGGFAMPLMVAEIPILLYLPAFYAQEVGISASLVGLVFLSARIWDGTADMVVGWLSDRTRLRLGRRKPWVMIGAPLLIVATWFLCNPPAGAGLLHLAVWAALFYTADAIAKITYWSWGAELATDYVERSRVTAYRGTFSMVGTLIFVSAPLVFLPQGAALSSVLGLISLTLLALIPLTAILLGVFVPDPLPVEAARANLLKGLLSLAKDRVFTVFGIAILSYGTANGVINSLAVFSLGVGLQLPGRLPWVIFILYMSTLCFLPLTMRLAQHLEKHRILAGGFTVLAVAYSSHLLLPPGNFVATGALWVVAGIGNSAVLVLPTSMLADIIDRGEIIASERRSGAYMAVYNLVTKIGLALGVGLSFVLLDLVGFNAAAHQHSAADARNVRLLGFALPGLLLLPAILLIWRHEITRKVHRRLREQIDSRKVMNASAACAEAVAPQGSTRESLQDAHSHRR